MGISQWGLSGFIRDSKSGKLSATRIVFLGWGITVLVIWAKISWSSGQVAAIPASVATIMGLLAGGKTIQKFREGKDSG